MANYNVSVFDFVTAQYMILSAFLVDTSSGKVTPGGDIDMAANDLLNVGAIAPDTLTVPGTTTPAQTAAGVLVYDTDDKVMTVGDGVGRTILGDTDTAQAFTNKDLSGAGMTWPTFTASEVSLALADLTDVGSKTGSGTAVVMQTSPTITTPTLSGNVVHDLATNDLTIAVTDQATGVATANIPDLGGVSQDFVFTAEAAVFTNKSIDFDNNTGTNIAYDAIKSSSRTGLDVKLVTGTMGSNGELMMANGDGDLVTSSKTVSDFKTTFESLTDVTITTGAEGDLYYRDAADEVVNLGIGSAAQVLTVTGGNPSWETPTTGTMDDFLVGADTGSNQTVTDGVLLDIVGGPGVATSVAAGSAIVTVTAVADATGGANLATAIDVNSNGLAIGVDDVSIEDNGSDQLRIKASGVGATEFDLTDTYAITGSIDMTGGTMSVATPTADSHAASMGWVNSVLEGLAIHAPARVLLATNPALLGSGFSFDQGGGVSLNGEITWSSDAAIDGVTLINNDRILITGGGVGTPEVSSVTCVANSSDSLNNTWFSFNTTESQRYIMWFNSNGGGTEPVVTPVTDVTDLYIEITIGSNDSAAVIASAIEVVMLTQVRKAGETELIDCFTIAGAPGTFTINNNFGCAVIDIADGTAGTGFTLSVTTPGVGVDPSINTIWVRESSTKWTLATDLNTDDQLHSGDYVLIEEGSTYALTGWVISAVNPLSFREPVQWFQFSGVGAYTAAADEGLQLTGTEFGIKPDVTTGGAYCRITTGANGASVLCDNDTVIQTTGVLSVGLNAIDASHIDETDDYAFSGAMNISGATVTLPLTINTALGNQFTFDEQIDIVMFPHSTDIAENLFLATAGGVTLGNVVSLVAAGTLSLSDANDPTHGTGFIGVVLESAAGGAKVKTIKEGRAVVLVVAGQSAVALGSRMYLSAVTPGSIVGPGGVPTAAGDVVQCVGTLVDKLAYTGTGNFWMEIDVHHYTPIEIV